jgi:16S rRNA (guanine(1405)-N(7))-methyltransferase
LHQVFGAYATEIDPVRALASLHQARATGGAAWQQACVDLMGRHASTRERLPILGRFYREIFAITGPPTSVLDLACGLGPLALPWMALPPESVYEACDVDRRLVEVVDGFLSLAGQPHQAILRDVVADPPLVPAHVAFLLKSAPCLEQQAPGSARRLLERLNAQWLVVSYPTRSLGGAGKGMLATYRSQFRALIEGLAGSVDELLFPGELVYVARCVSSSLGDCAGRSALTERRAGRSQNFRVRSPHPSPLPEGEGTSRERHPEQLRAPHRAPAMAVETLA